MSDSREFGKQFEETHRLGLPNIYSRKSKIIYNVPNGVIIAKENPQK